MRHLAINPATLIWHMSKTAVELLLERMSYLTQNAKNVRSGNGQHFSICKWSQYDEEDKKVATEKFALFGKKNMKSRLKESFYHVNFFPIFHGFLGDFNNYSQKYLFETIKEMWHSNVRYQEREVFTVQQMINMFTETKTNKLMFDDISDTGNFTNAYYMVSSKHLIFEIL